MQNTIRRPLVCIATLMVALAASSPTTAADMVLVADGQARATIVVAKDGAEPARQKIQTAAEELQAYVREDLRRQAADRRRFAEPGRSADPRGPEPAERLPGRGDSRRSQSGPPRGRFCDRLQRRPAAPGRQQRRPLPRHRVRGLRFSPQPGRAVVHAGRVRRDRAARRRRSACPSSGWRRSRTS